MNILSSTGEINSFISAASKKTFVTIDTEFIREKTYYADLCLIQIAFKGENGEQDSALIDPLNKSLDLTPFFKLMKDSTVLKVFHAARQDLEIFYSISGYIPNPIFDTQIAAMVCGFGDQISYEKLVKECVGISLDKSSRFSNWAYRPLTSEQYSYALGDVTFLRDVYLFLKARLDENGRELWVKEEMERLCDTKSYFPDPSEAWRRIKMRGGNNKYLAILRDLAEFREKEAQNKNISRRRILSDDAILEIASKKPNNPSEISKLRFLSKESQKSWIGKNIQTIVSNADPTKAPIVGKDIYQKEERSNPRLVELLKVLLSFSSEQSGVAPKIIASVDDLKEIATKENPVSKAVNGWRKEIFGSNALKLKNGKIALCIRNGQLMITKVH